MGGPPRAQGEGSPGSPDLLSSSDAEHLVRGRAARAEDGLGVHDLGDALIEVAPGG